MILSDMPMIGRKGMSGQITTRTKQSPPPTMIKNSPTIRRTNLVKKPTILEISRSRNMWNLRSREESVPAVSADI